MCDYCFDVDEDQQDLTECATCTNFICLQCQVQGVHLDDWLFTAPVCDFCLGATCRECLEFCVECANAGPADMRCPACEPKLPLFDLGCDLHCRQVCARHVGAACCECRANRNFGLKAQDARPAESWPAEFVGDAAANFEP